MKKELILDDDIECNECGKVGCPRTLIWLDHLCKHFIALCDNCLTEVKKLIVIGKYT